MRVNSTSTMIMMISFISVMSLSCSSLSVTSSMSLISRRSSIRVRSIVIDSSRKPSDTTYLNLFYSTRVLLL